MLVEELVRIRKIEAGILHPLRDVEDDLR